MAVEAVMAVGVPTGSRWVVRVKPWVASVWRVAFVGGGGRISRVSESSAMTVMSGLRRQGVPSRRFLVE